MRITFLGSESCPNTPPMRETLRRALALLGMAADVEEIDQEGLATDDVRRVYPTPTILLDGQDLQAINSPDRSAMACRVYPKGLPSSEEIAQLLNRAIRND